MSARVVVAQKNRKNTQQDQCTFFTDKIIAVQRLFNIFLCHFLKYFYKVRLIDVMLKLLRLNVWCNWILYAFIKRVDNNIRIL